MANLFTGSVNTQGEYQDISTLSGVTFVNDTTYTLQIQNTAWIREGETGKGFLVTDITPFYYTARGNTLYIRTENFPAILNIAD